jgi:type IX secretion system PorP/SprF family membrane protein
MILRYRAVIAGLLLFTVSIYGQDTWYGTVSGIQLMYNPAFAGTAGAPSLRVNAFSFFPGKGFGLQSVYASYDGYFSSLHGGAGLWLSDDVLGDIMNDLRAGASYAYHFRAGRDIFITAGLTAALMTRGIKSGSVILPDDIDPFRGFTGGGTEYFAPAPATRFDLGTGLTIASGKWYAGASVMHLTRPSLSEEATGQNRIERLFTVTGGTVITTGNKDLSFTPSASILIQGKEPVIYLGGEASWKGVSGGLALWHVNGGYTAMTGAAGWQSSSLMLTISYSYLLNSRGVTIGGTAIINAGAAFSFGNVEKSKAIHIIKLPHL